MPVCVDPPHSVGTRELSSDGILDVAHVASQGLVAGASVVLVDFHPESDEALVDGPQALLMDELSKFLDDMAGSHEFYQTRLKIWQAGQAIC